MKAWEETWTVISTASPIERAHGVEHGPWMLVNERGQIAAFGDGCANPDAARLAAAAPEALRLLMELEWRPEPDYPGDMVCASCNSLKEQGHRDDCRLVAVLRKAGVQ